MPKYRIEISCTKTETYEVEAADKDEAQDNVFIDGALVKTEEEAETITGVTLIEELAPHPATDAYEKYYDETERANKRPLSFEDWCNKQKGK